MSTVQSAAVMNLLLNGRIINEPAPKVKSAVISISRHPFLIVRVASLAVTVERIWLPGYDRCGHQVYNQLVVLVPYCTDRQIRMLLSGVYLWRETVTVCLMLGSSVSTFLNSWKSDTVRSGPRLRVYSRVSRYIGTELDLDWSRVKHATTLNVIPCSWVHLLVYAVRSDFVISRPKLGDNVIARFSNIWKTVYLHVVLNMSPCFDYQNAP